MGTTIIGNTSGCSLESNLFLDLSVVELNQKHLEILGRGGDYWQYFWCNKTIPPVWFKSGKPTRIPNWQAVYANYFPSKRKLEGYGRGDTSNVAAINCLYGEFDKKDGWTFETMLDSFKVAPSTIIFSGHGWHCCWYLKDTIYITFENLDEIRNIVYRWIDFIGSDPGAKDLTRMLRIPGSFNNKDGEPIEVTYLKADFDLFYDLDDLVKLLPPVPPRKPKMNYPPDLLKDIVFASTQLERLSPERANDYQEWLEVGMALSYLGDYGLGLWEWWSEKNCPEKYDENVCDQKWPTFFKDNQRNKITIGSLKYWADLDNGIDDTEDTRFNLKTVSDLFKPRIKRDFIIDGLLIEKSVGIWFGKYGHKKTFVALSAAIHVASGREWLGLKTKQCPVLFINEDDTEDSLMDRIEAGLKGESLENEDIPLYFMSLSGFNFLKNPEDIEHLKSYIRESEAGLVFIDALDDVAAGFDENSVKDLQPLFLMLRNVAAEIGTTLVILHHSNRRGDIRGSSSIPGGADSTIKIESENGSSNIRITTDKIRFTKDFKKNANITYVNKEDQNLLDKFYLSEGEETPFDNLKINDRDKIILEYMENNNNDLAMVDFLQTIPNKDKQSWRTSIYALRDKGIIEKNEEKSKHNYSVFSMVVSL